MHTANQNPSGLGTFVYNLRFPGQYYDAETGLNYNYFRDYDPAVGRYVESDPIGLDGGSYSTYGYVNNNPLSNWDPTGTGPFGTAIGAGVGGFLGGVGGGAVGGALGAAGGTVVAPGVGTVGVGVTGAEAGAGIGAALGAAIGGFIGDGIENLITDPLQTARGNVADTQIVKDYGEAASAAKLCGKGPPDRCDWLKQNASKYRRDQVIATQKAWGCRGSRASK